VLSASSWTWQRGLRSRRRWVPALVMVVAWLSLASCQRAGEDALLIGRLYGDALVGCVWIGGSRAGAEVEWPSSVHVEFSPVRVTGPRFVAREGDWFRVAGGTRPTVPITRNCPGSQTQNGRFVPKSIEYFGNERPSDKLDFEAP
jgi:hypothetical protein